MSGVVLLDTHSSGDIPAGYAVKLIVAMCNGFCLERFCSGRRGKIDAATKV